MNFTHIKKFYKDYNVYVGSGTSRGLARNDGARMASRAGHQVLFFVDADMMVLPEQITAATDLALESGKLVYPYNELIRLSLTESHSVIQGFAPANRQGRPEAGAVAITVQSFNTVRGYPDLNLFEDAVFLNVCDTLLGLTERLPGKAWHMWHPESDHIGQYGDRKLLGQFEAAVRDAGRMRALIERSNCYAGFGNGI